MKYVSIRKGFDEVDGPPVDAQAWFGKPASAGGEPAASVTIGYPTVQ